LSNHKTAHFSFQTVVINLSSRADRRAEMTSRLVRTEINFDFMAAVEPKDLAVSDSVYLNDVTTCVWKSHKKALEIASKSHTPTLILEDDAVLSVGCDVLTNLISEMELHRIDFLQVGYLRLNAGEGLSIKSRNVYDFVTRRSLAPRFFGFFGFKEVSRVKGQDWRRDLPSDFILNDVRYGAHCYIVMPGFAGKVLKLNDPAFLSADDFYVALSKMRSFRMARLKQSQSSQDDSPSSFSTRYIHE